MKKETNHNHDSRLFSFNLDYLNVTQAKKLREYLLKNKIHYDYLVFGDDGNNKSLSAYFSNLGECEGINEDILKEK